MTDKEIRAKVVDLLTDAGMLGTVYRDHSEQELINAAAYAFAEGYLCGQKKELK